jgi:heme/copper-type cytochrome/quinol oxidase subunit 2
MSALRGWEWLIIFVVVVFVIVVIGAVVGVVVWALRRGSRPPRPEQPGLPPTTSSGPGGV